MLLLNGLTQFLTDRIESVGHSTSLQIVRSTIQGSGISPYELLADSGSQTQSPHRSYSCCPLWTCCQKIWAHSWLASTLIAFYRMYLSVSVYLNNSRSEVKIRLHWILFSNLLSSI